MSLRGRAHWLRDPWLSLAALLWSFAIALVVSSIAHAGFDETPSSGPNLIPPGVALDPLHPTLEFANTSQLGMGTWDGGTSSACGQCGNPVSYPQDLNNAVWNPLGSGIAAPTVTANAAVAPDGTLTAERVQIPSAGSTANAFSQLYQSFGPLAAGNWTCSAYVKGNGTSGTLNLRANDMTNHCTGCSYTASDWTRCSLSVALDGTANVLSVGSFSTVTYPCTGSNGLAFDGYVWGYRCTAGLSADSYYATPSGTRNEPMTFARASSGTCLKSGTTTGIANGDMVTCSSGQPRVMPGGDGTGGNGLLVEGPRTNLWLRSQEFDNAAWSQENDVSAPIVTADAAVAPDGTTTADRLQFPATTLTHYSDLYQVAVGSGATSACVFFKGVSGAGRVNLTILDSGSGVQVDCVFVSTSWTLCKNQNVARAASGPIYIGNSGWSSSASRSAVDVYAWGLNGEAAAFCSSYIATTTAAVTRAAETVTFPALAALASAGSAAATVVSPDTSSTSSHGIIHMGATGAPLYFKAGGSNIAAYDGTAETLLGTTWSTQPHRYASSWTGTVLTVFDSTASTSAAGTFHGAMATTNVCLGSGTGGTACGSAGSFLDGVLKQVCLDSSSARCR